MIKQLQKLKTSIILLMLIFSLFIVISPVEKSLPMDQIYECTPFIELEYNKTLLQKPVIPYDEPTKIPLTVKTKIIGPAADIVAGGLSGVFLIVDLSIEETSEGCYASINPPVLKFNASTEFESENATLSFTINRYFQANILKNVKINLSVRRLGGSATLVKPETFIQEISFIVGYFSQLSFEYPEGNVKAINPGDTANFPIEIENWGNAVTNVYIETIDVPDGWSASITKNLTLETNLFGREYNETVLLTVKPPINFGYHEDRAVIKVKMTPVEYNKTENVGEPSYLYFVIQSTGFSTPGFEVVTLFLAAILIFLPVILKKKTTKKQQSNQLLRRVRK